MLFDFFKQSSKFKNIKARMRVKVIQIGEFS